MGNRSDLSRRIAGAVFLVAAIVMLLLGQFVLSGWLHEHPVPALLFWLSSFVLVFLAMIVALLDLWIVRRRSREEHRGLLTETLDRIAKEKESRKPNDGTEQN